MVKIHQENNMRKAATQKSYIFSFTGRSYYGFGYFAYNEIYGIKIGRAA
jgi:hypothetical protein